MSPNPLSADSPYRSQTLHDTYPYDVTVTRNENEGFGFVIISSVTRAGSTIGEYIGTLSAIGGVMHPSFPTFFTFLFVPPSAHTPGLCCAVNSDKKFILLDWGGGDFIITIR